MTERGSESLREQWARGGFELPADLIERVIQLTGEFEVDSVLVKGQPRPDLLRAAFTVEGDERCGNGVRELLKLIGDLRLGRGGRIVVFPKGIPVDKFTVELELGTG
jgi:hypothetical protein